MACQFGKSTIICCYFKCETEVTILGLLCLKYFLLDSYRKFNGGFWFILLWMGWIFTDVHWWSCGEVVLNGDVLMPYCGGVDFCSCRVCAYVCVGWRCVDFLLWWRSLLLAL
jgi:hypothetical protein